MKIESRKIGDWTGLMLPADVAARLGAAEGKPLYLTEVKSGELRITTFDPEFEGAMSLVDGIMDEYEETLRVLAK